jgi:tetratricopeptide (TPR) repeat protein
LADLERTGRPEVAAAGYEAWLADAPRDTLALFGLANSRFANGEAAAAEAAYLRLLAIRPGDPAASNNLAQLLLERGCAGAARRILDRINEPVPAVLRGAVQATRALAAESESEEAACRTGG